ncbi:MAG: CapA family protein [Dehalococcoidia bacterium]
MLQRRARPLPAVLVRFALLALVATALLSVACEGDADLEAAGGTAAAATPALAGASPPPARSVAVEVADPAEADRYRAALEAAGFTVADHAETRVTDAAAGIGASEGFLARSWVIVTHPRSALLDAGDDLAGLLHGPGPIVATPAAAAWLAGAFPSDSRELQTASLAEVIGAVATRPDALGVIPAEELTPEVRALVVAGFDPYRDAPDANPLAEYRRADGPLAGEVREVIAGAVPPEEPVLFLATGELIPARCVSDRVAGLEEGYGTTYDGTRDLIAGADLVVAHWEPAVIEGPPTPCTPTFNLSTRPEAARAAAEAGVDVALAVGNHVGDCWPGCAYQSAVIETVAHLEAAGLLTVGAGPDLAAAREPVIVQVDGVTFAILAYDDIAFQHYGATATTAGTAHADLDGLAEDVRRAAERADHVVVGFSWGIEYTATPSARQRELARTAVKAGASLVVGNHPHWVQATEWIGDGFVAYGLGNFVFDQDWSVETTQGAILEVGFSRERILGVRLRPTVVRQQYAVELLDPADAEGGAILQRMWDASDALSP